MKSRPTGFVRPLSVLLVTLFLALSVASCALVLPVKKPEGRPAPAKPASVPAAAPEAKAAPASAKPSAPSPGAATKPAAPAGEPKAAAAPPSAPAPAPGPLELTAQRAVLLALENNQELVVQRLQPQIVKTAEDDARAVFDPLLAGQVGWQYQNGEFMDAQGDQFHFITNSVVGRAGVSEFFPTGTTVGLDWTSGVADRSVRSQLIRTRFGLTVTQALLRGFGPEVNLAAVREAKLNTTASEYELRGFVLVLAANAEAAYWDYVRYAEQAETIKQSLALSESLLKNIQVRVSAGTSPAIDLAAAQSEASLRQQDLIDAEVAQSKALVRLRRLLNPPGDDLWTREVRAAERPSVKEAQVESVESHVQVALRMRPELNQARVGIERGDVEVVRTQNGLLPRMDLFVSIGKSGYANSFGSTWERLGSDERDFLAGVSLQYPVGNHAARGRYRRAVLTRRMAEEALKNLEQLVQEEVRTAYLEVQRAKSQVAASAATRKLDEDKLRAEMDKLAVGKSTSFQVARAQRDLNKSKLAEVQAALDYQKALVELYRFEGSLLERRGVSAPGRGPVDSEQASRRPPPGAAARPQ